MASARSASDQTTSSAPAAAPPASSLTWAVGSVVSSEPDPPPQAATRATEASRLTPRPRYLRMGVPYLLGHSVCRGDHVVAIGCGCGAYHGDATAGHGELAVCLLAGEDLGTAERKVGCAVVMVHGDGVVCALPVTDHELEVLGEGRRGDAGVRIRGRQHRGQGVGVQPGAHVPADPGAEL